jgi:hypothetical protein
MYADPFLMMGRLLGTRSRILNVRSSSIRWYPGDGFPNLSVPASRNKPRPPRSAKTSSPGCTLTVHSRFTTHDRDAATAGEEAWACR